MGLGATKRVVAPLWVMRDWSLRKADQAKAEVSIEMLTKKI